MQLLLTSQDLEKEASVLRAVVNRMIERERYLIVQPDSVQAKQKDDRILELHPNCPKLQ